MGSGQSAAPEVEKKKIHDKKSSVDIDQKLQDDKLSEDGTVKLLLLGAGESGKSTLFKQAVQLYGKGFDDNARATYKPVIHANIIEAIQTLCQQSEALGDSYKISADLVASKKVVLDLNKDQLIDQEVAGHIKKLWADAGIQSVYGQRNTFQLVDCAAYLLGNVDAVAKKDYLPSFQDVVRCRARTTSIVQTELVMNDTKFLLLDVGGQRSQRKKWIHCFEGVTAVIYVAAISEYDQVLLEDNKTNRITESLQLFNEIANSKWFQSTHIILFLNKRDLFEEKLKRVDLHNFYADFPKGGDYSAACDFMRNLFHSQCQDKDKKIYTHVTCATDTENTSFTFAAVRDIILRQRMGSIGMI